MARIGYGRFSTRDQNPDSQLDALAEAGCDKVFIDKASGKLASLPELDRALEYARAGDTFVITRLARAARSLKHLLELAEALRSRGIELLVLKQGIDTVHNPAPPPGWFHRRLTMPGQGKGEVLTSTSPATPGDRAVRREDTDKDASARSGTRRFMGAGMTNMPSWPPSP